MVTGYDHLLFLSGGISSSTDMQKHIRYLCKPVLLLDTTLTMLLGVYFNIGMQQLHHRRDHRPYSGVQGAG